MKPLLTAIGVLLLAQLTTSTTEAHNYAPSPKHVVCLGCNGLQTRKLDYTKYPSGSKFNIQLNLLNESLSNTP
jgi:hypothetical protein